MPKSPRTRKSSSPKSGRSSPKGNKSSSDKEEDKEICAICLSKPQNKSFTDSCLHEFCFACLQEWSKIKASCPLCQQSFTSIIHTVRTISDYQIYKVPPPIEPIDDEASLRTILARLTRHTGSISISRPFRYRTTLDRGTSYSSGSITRPHDSSMRQSTSHGNRGGSSSQFPPNSLSYPTRRTASGESFDQNLLPSVLSLSMYPPLTESSVDITASIEPLSSINSLNATLSWETQNISNGRGTSHSAGGNHSDRNLRNVDNYTSSFHTREFRLPARVLPASSSSRHSGDSYDYGRWEDDHRLRDARIPSSSLDELRRSFPSHEHRSRSSSHHRQSDNSTNLVPQQPSTFNHHSSISNNVQHRDTHDGVHREGRGHSFTGITSHHRLSSVSDNSNSRSRHDVIHRQQHYRRHHRDSNVDRSSFSSIDYRHPNISEQPVTNDSTSEMSTRWSYRRRVEYYLRSLWVDSSISIDRDVSPNFLRANPAQLARFVPFLFRELKVLRAVFNIRPSRSISAIVEDISDQIQRHAIDSREFRLFLTATFSSLGCTAIDIDRHLNHFIHEFLMYAKSPCVSCEQFDMLGRWSFHAEGANVTNSSANLDYPFTNRSTFTNSSSRWSPSPPLTDPSLPSVSNERLFTNTNNGAPIGSSSISPHSNITNNNSTGGAEISIVPISSSGYSAPTTSTRDKRRRRRSSHQDKDRNRAFMRLESKRSRPSDSNVFEDSDETNRPTTNSAADSSTGYTSTTTTNSSNSSGLLRRSQTIAGYPPDSIPHHSVLDTTSTRNPEELSWLSKKSNKTRNEISSTNRHHSSSTTLSSDVINYGRSASISGSGLISITAHNLMSDDWLDNYNSLSVGRGRFSRRNSQKSPRPVGLPSASTISNNRTERENDDNFTDRDTTSRDAGSAVSSSSVNINTTSTDTTTTSSTAHDGNVVQISKGPVLYNNSSSGSFSTANASVIERHVSNDNADDSVDDDNDDSGDNARAEISRIRNFLTDNLPSSDDDNEVTPMADDNNRENREDTSRPTVTSAASNEEIIEISSDSSDDDDDVAVVVDVEPGRSSAVQFNDVSSSTAVSSAAMVPPPSLDSSAIQSSSLSSSLSFSSSRRLLNTAIGFLNETRETMRKESERTQATYNLPLSQTPWDTPPRMPSDEVSLVDDISTSVSSKPTLPTSSESSSIQLREEVLRSTSDSLSVEQRPLNNENVNTIGRSSIFPNIPFPIPYFPNIPPFPTAYCPFPMPSVPYCTASANPSSLNTTISSTETSSIATSTISGSGDAASGNATASFAAAGHPYPLGDYRQQQFQSFYDDIYSQDMRESQNSYSNNARRG